MFSERKKKREEEGPRRKRRGRLRPGRDVRSISTEYSETSPEDCSIENESE